MTKPSVVIPQPPDAPGILHVDTSAALCGPTPTHDVGHEAGVSVPGRLDDASLDQVKAAAASDETVRRLAYALWEARGCPHGSSDVDWTAAEREVKGRYRRVRIEGTPVKARDGGGFMKSDSATLEDG